MAQFLMSFQWTQETTLQKIKLKSFLTPNGQITQQHLNRRRLNEYFKKNLYIWTLFFIIITAGVLGYAKIGPFPNDFQLNAHEISYVDFRFAKTTVCQLCVGPTLLNPNRAYKPFPHILWFLTKINFFMSFSKNSKI